MGRPVDSTETPPLDPAMGHARRPLVAAMGTEPAERGQRDQRSILVTGLWGGDPAAGVPTEADRPADREPPSQRGRAGGDNRGRRRAARSRRPFRGRPVGDAPAGPHPIDVAWAATVRAAACRRGPDAGPGVTVEPDALRRQLRVRRPDHLILFAVDISGSMGGTLTALARDLAVAALRDAYLERARVAMLAFHQRGARLLLAPTRKIDRVDRALTALPCGGTTPLAAGLQLSARTLVRWLAGDRSRHATVVLISDGRANVGTRPIYGGVLAEVEAEAHRLAAIERVRVLLLDTTEAGKDDRPAADLAAWLAARRVALAGLRRAGRDPAAVLSRALH